MTETQDRRSFLATIAAGAAGAALFPSILFAKEEVFTLAMIDEAVAKAKAYYPNPLTVDEWWQQSIDRAFYNNLCA